MSVTGDFNALTRVALVVLFLLLLAGCGRGIVGETPSLALETEPAPSPALNTDTPEAEKDSFYNARMRMVADTIEARGVSDGDVLRAMRTVARHEFVPDEHLQSAYADHPLPIGYGQTISQPYIVAWMTELLELKAGEKVLEIGTGSGYQAAVLAEIAGQVVTTERVKQLAEEARRTLRELGYANIEVIVTDGSAGFVEGAPYDGIIVTAGAPEIPSVLVDQLADGGRLVIPVGNNYQQTLTRLRKMGSERVTERLEGCVFVPLIGKYGWGEHGEDDRR